MSSSISPQLQEQVARLQQLQQTLQILIAQKQQLEMELADTERALGELEKIAVDAVIYKSIGALLVKSSRQDVIKELKERKDLVNTRITVLAKQDERAREKFKELQQKLQERLRPESKPNSKEEA